VVCYHGLLQLRAFAIAPDPIAELLAQSRTIAVVGLSSRRTRPSHEVAAYLQRAGYQIFPVNPNETEVLGVRAWPTLEALANHLARAGAGKIDIVDIFRRSGEVPAVIESAIAIGAKAIWMQEGVIHAQAFARARAAGLTAVMDLCILKEHASRIATGEIR
jgi:predicted CoA-binding protein